MFEYNSTRTKSDKQNASAGIKHMARPNRPENTKISGIVIWDNLNSTMSMIAPRINHLSGSTGKADL